MTPNRRIWIVAFEYAPFPGGQGTFSTAMARAFRNLGYPVTVIVPAYDNNGPDPDDLVTHRVLRHQKLDGAAIIAVIRALRGVQPDDIVVAFDIRAGIATTMAKLRYRFKKILLFCGGEIIRAESKFGWLGNYVASLGAQKLIGISRFTAGMVERYLRRPCATVLLGVSRVWLEKPAEQFESPILAALPTDTPWVTTVARIARRKGHLGAIAALRTMQEQGPLPTIYVIAGRVIDPDYFAELNAIIAASNGRIVYAGEISQSDVRLLYARSRVFLLPATAEPGDIEGFGLVITESGGQGCPAIATRVGGISDAVIDQQTGLLYNENDIAGVAHGIRTLLTDPVLRDRLGAAARSYAESLTWEENARQTLAGL